MRALLFVVAAGTMTALAQAPAPPPQASRPLFSASVRLEDWALFRSAAASVLGWKIGAPAGAFRELTFSEAAAKVDALGLAYIQGDAAQKFSAEIPKNLDYRLAPGELEAVRDRLRALNMRMSAYTTSMEEGEAIGKVFPFAKALGVETIISSPPARLLPLVDKLASEFGINVAINNDSDPKTLLRALEGRSDRIGAAADLGKWTREGVKPLDGLAVLKSRLMTVSLRETTGLAEFLGEMYKMGTKPSFVSIDATSASVDALDKALHPLIADCVNEISRTAAIRTPDRLPVEERQKIEAALPQRARVQPKKARKLLVMDLNVSYGGHRSIPHANLALELMAKRTGAFEAVFSNDLVNLTYDKIRQFDAIYLNNTVGMIFVDPKVRDGLSRFVREGGGLAGNHGVSHASMDWPEFGEMIGAKWGVHREPTEIATVKIEDPSHPLTAAFGGKEFVYQDEFFRFPIGPYSRDKLRVLLTIDVAKTDMNQGRPCPKPCVRRDNDYAVSWIRSYGKGRVFFCILGHNPTLYMTPNLAEYFLAGIQFILGDLEADTTPSGVRQVSGRPGRK
ncbi:MAG: ThuA domain-containing protein [Bryobacteraceae bacterium]